MVLYFALRACWYFYIGFFFVIVGWFQERFGNLINIQIIQ